MSFEFGIFHEFARYAGQTDAEVFAQSFAQVDAAERFGLDVVWLAELHFLPERSVASAPLLLARQADQDATVSGTVPSHHAANGRLLPFPNAPSLPKRSRQ